jgi:hypothetical protein
MNCPLGEWRLRSTTDLIENARPRALCYRVCQCAGEGACGSTIFDFDPAYAGFPHFGVATLSRCSQPWITLGDLGWNWVYIGGRGTPLPKSAGKFGRKLTKSFCLLAGAMAHKLLGAEKTHEIDAKMVQMG